MSNKTPLTKHLLEFLTVANEFTIFLETKYKGDRDSYVDISLKLFSLLYLKALFFDKPAIDTDGEDYNFEFITAARYETVKANAEISLGDVDIYVPLRDAAMINSEDFINISLSEMIADVFQDVGNFVEACRIGEDKLIEEASVRCLANFESFWGIRLIGLIEQFHRIKFIKNSEL